MNNFEREASELKKYMLEAAKKVIDSGHYILGGELKSFESSWAQVCCCEYGVGVGNGMDAIEIILRSLNIGPGDEVITTPMTAFATVLAIYRAGAIPVLADIDSQTGLLSLESVANCVTARTKAVILVHLYGQMSEMNNWVNFTRESKIFLIEDCAQSHLAELENKRAGSFGIAGAYSFYPTKNLGAMGDAGMVVTNSIDVFNKAVCLRNYGQTERYHHPEIGLNSRLDEIQAAILSERIKWLQGYTDIRRQIAKRYRVEISNPLITHMLSPVDEKSHSYHLFVIRCEKREHLQKYLLDNNIQTLIHYPIPIHKQEPCLDVLRDKNGLSNAEKHAQTALSIPCNPQLTLMEVNKIIDAINRYS